MAHSLLSARCHCGLVVERLLLRFHLFAGKLEGMRPEDTPSNLPAEKMKPEKKPSDYQSAVARHLAESKECAMAYSDSSFRVVRACPLSSNLEIMEALYIKGLTPNLCVQKSSIAHLQLFRHR